MAHHGHPGNTRSRTRLTMERVSNQLTRLIGARYGHIWPEYFVCEYPRSGGTWLAKMLADYFGVAKPGVSVFPVGMRAVIHNHWKFHPKLRNVFYLMRDGRDVMTSYYFYRMRSIQQKHTYQHKAMHENFQRVLGADYDAEDSRGNMAAFLRYEFENPTGSRLHWGQHIENWVDFDKHAYMAYIKYEDLLERPFEALKTAIEHIVKEEIVEHKLHTAIDHCSMETQTGRKRGEEDKGSFIRKGIAGDWLNHFDAKAAKVFDEFAGAALVKAGYEADRDWMSRYDLPE